MNSNEYNILRVLLDEKKPMFFRELSKKSKVSIGGTQKVLKDFLQYLIKKVEGKNTYYSFKNDLDAFYLKNIVEIYKAKYFIKNNTLLKDLILNLIKIVDGPVIIFGSYARGDYESDSDLDVLILGNYDEKEFNQIIKRYPVKLHNIDMKMSQFRSGIIKKQPFINEVIKSHIILSGFDAILKELWSESNE